MTPNNGCNVKHRFEKYDCPHFQIKPARETTYSKLNVSWEFHRIFDSSGREMAALINSNTNLEKKRKIGYVQRGTSNKLSSWEKRFPYHRVQRGDTFCEKPDKTLLFREKGVPSGIQDKFLIARRWPASFAQFRDAIENEKQSSKNSHRKNSKR